MNQYRILSLLCLTLLLSAFKCQDDSPKPCSDDLACTLEFRTISIQVVDTEANPVKLDSYQVLDTKSGEDITSPHADELLADPNEGFYILFDDSHMAKYKGKKIKVTFKGYKDGNLIAQGTFDVGADCCHVFPITKNLRIIVDDHAGCDPLTMCTEEFRTVTIKVLDQDKNPVKLSSYKVIDKASGKELTSMHTGIVDPSSGDYILIDDSHLSTYKNKKGVAVFMAYIDGLKVGEQFFEVGGDCCHIYAVTTDLTMTVTLGK